MDAAPLTQAHAAARADQFVAAARGFADAAAGVDDLEAIRVLGLLEEQHRRLAQLVAAPAATVPVQAPASVKEPASPPREHREALKEATRDAPRRSASPTLQRKLGREGSSSIASDLATARGIPPNKRRAQPVKEVKEQQAEEPIPSVLPTAVDSEEPFNKFYSTFEGLLSKLSAPLAFAGLPLTADEAQPDKRRQTRATTTGLPDVNRLFSKAALDAVTEGRPGFGGVHESFTLVPAGGGSLSYASVVSSAGRQAGHGPGHSARSSVDDVARSEHFVDARESPAGQARRVRTAGSTGTTGKTTEELEMENASLKQRLDKLAQRLYMWEASAQSQSMALQQSVRQLKPPGQAGHGPPGRGDSRPPAEPRTDRPDRPDDRVAGLEKQLAAARADVDRAARENDKLRSVVLRYRERWEKLKEGARVRREGAERAGGARDDGDAGDILGAPTP